MWYVSWAFFVFDVLFLIANTMIGLLGLYIFKQTLDDQKQAVKYREEACMYRDQWKHAKKHTVTEGYL